MATSAWWAKFRLQRALGSAKETIAIIKRVTKGITFRWACPCCWAGGGSASCTWRASFFRRYKLSDWGVQATDATCWCQPQPALPSLIVIAISAVPSEEVQVGPCFWEEKVNLFPSSLDLLNSKIDTTSFCTACFNIKDFSPKAGTSIQDSWARHYAPSSFTTFVGGSFRATSSSVLAGGDALGWYIQYLIVGNFGPRPSNTGFIKPWCTTVYHHGNRAATPAFLWSCVWPYFER